MRVKLEVLCIVIDGVVALRARVVVTLLSQLNLPDHGFELLLFLRLKPNSGNALLQLLLNLLPDNVQRACACERSLPLLVQLRCGRAKWLLPVGAQPRLVYDTSLYNRFPWQLLEVAGACRAVGVLVRPCLFIFVQYFVLCRQAVLRRVHFLVFAQGLAGVHWFLRALLCKLAPAQRKPSKHK